MNRTMQKIEKNKQRVIADPFELEWLRRAVSYATANLGELDELFPGEPSQFRDATLAHLKERIELLQGPAKRKLKWVPDPEGGETVYAFLGVPGDSVMFSLTHYPTCYRRGQWRLMIEVAHGPKHHDWGCLDSDDQPLRNFHSLFNAIDEAELIAAVLEKDRLQRGPYEETQEWVEWVRPLWELTRKATQS